MNKFDGTVSIPLNLDGFVEPDKSLRVFPVNLEFDGPRAMTSLSAILHFKGSASLLTKIPDTLIVTPGHDQRVLLPIVHAGDFNAVATKDVQIELTRNSGDEDTKDWESSIVFAPDPASDGLTIHLRGHASRPVVVTPQTIMLTDGEASRETTVRLTTNSGNPVVPMSAETRLPLELNFLPGPLTGSESQTLRIRVKERLSGDVAGTIRVRLRTRSQIVETISIPVVILKEG